MNKEGIEKISKILWSVLTQRELIHLLPYFLCFDWTCNWYQSYNLYNLLTTNKERNEQLEMGLGGLQDGTSPLELEFQRYTQLMIRPNGSTRWVNSLNTKAPRHHKRENGYLQAN